MVDGRLCYEARVAEHVEVERKYDAVPGRALPDLDGVAGLRLRGPAEESALEATYLDTPDLRLGRRKVTLRRRTGGSDAGWHLKLPASGDARTEVRAPLGRATRTPPDALREEVRALVRDAVLTPVAVLRTRRVEHVLVDADDRPVALLADDTVTAERLAPERVRLEAWREVEVELVDPQAVDALDALDRALRAGGLSRSASSSKVARVLGEPSRDQPSSGLRPKHAGDRVHAHLREQVDELVARDRGARADAPDAVHKMRVATRRLRSALATFRPLLDRTRTDPLRAELTWLATALGAARDAEVMRDRIVAELRGQPAEPVLGRVVDHAERELSGRHAAAHSALVEVLRSERYLRLLDSLDDLLRQPPWSSRARRPAASELRRLVRRAVSRVEASQAAAARAEQPGERAARLHRVRKDAKRARYACEAAAPVLGERARSAAERWEAVQEVLGEYQDSVVARGLLRELGVRAHAAGLDGFTYGRLHGLEDGRADAALAAYRKAWAAATKPAARRWLR